MLGILVCYASFYDFETLQRKNIEKYVKCPYKVYMLHTTVSHNPSAGHMRNLNILLNMAWSECDSFLFFDNDMIFLSDFTEPTEDCWYVPQRKGEETEYAWCNLFYFKKDELLRSIDFENGSDSGGSTWRYLSKTLNKKEIVQEQGGLEEYQKKAEELADEYGLGNWCERWKLNSCYIFHFRNMSNWTKYEKTYINRKERLIIRTVQKLLDDSKL